MMRMSIESAPTFSAGFPLSQIGLYAGWYDGTVSGPFTRESVEFLPGAVAYHLHSFSAHTLRTADKHWCGPLLARGATATMGCVEEPFLAGTPDLGVFFHRLTAAGWTFGEAAYAAQGSLSWQTTIVGDPLYHPFARHPAELHADLIKRRSPLLAWSHLRVVNLNLAQGASAAEMVGYLNQQPETQTSAVLLEKLGDLQLKLEKPDLAVAAVMAGIFDRSLALPREGIAGKAVGESRRAVMRLITPALADLLAQLERDRHRMQAEIARLEEELARLKGEEASGARKPAEAAPAPATTVVKPSN